MGVFDQGYTRLKVLLILFGLLFFIGSCEAMFFHTEAPDVYGGFAEQEQVVDDYDVIDAIKDAPCPEGLYGLGCRIAQFFVGVGEILTGIGKSLAIFFGALYGALTFTLYPNIPEWIRVIMAPIMISITIIITYIIADIIYDVVKAAPTT